MKTKIMIIALLSLFLLSLLTGCMSEEKKALKATQTWLKKLKMKNYTLKKLKSLETLDLYNTKVTDAGISPLKTLEIPEIAFP